MEGENALAYPIMPDTQLTDKEAGAIYDYLQQIPSIKNAVDRSVYESLITQLRLLLLLVPVFGK